MRTIAKTIFCVFAATVVAMSSANQATAQTDAQMFFHSNFEDSVTITNSNITGADAILPAPNSWNDGGGLRNGKQFSSVGNLLSSGANPNDLDTTNPNAFFGIDKVADPTDPGNSAMRFSINAMPKAGPQNYGRHEHVLWGKRDDTRENSREIYYKFDMYLSPDLEQFANFPGEVSWMMLLEFWNDTNWETPSKPYPYRVSVNLRKNRGLNQPFYINTSSQFGEGRYHNVTGDWWYHPGETPPEGYTVNWGSRNEWVVRSDDPIPLGEWLTCEVYYKAGGRNEGEFYFAGTRPNGEKLVFCDKTGPDKGETNEDNRGTTANPYNPNKPGVAQWNPFKLYTAANNIRFINDLNVANINNGTPTNYAIEVLWDNVEYWTTMPKPGATSNLPATIETGKPLVFTGTLSEMNVHLKPGVRLIGKTGDALVNIPGKIKITPTGDMLTRGNYTAEFDATSFAGIPGGEYEIQILSSNKVVYSKKIAISAEVR